MALVSLSITNIWKVYRKHNSAISGCFCASHKSLCDLKARINIELKPQWAACCFRDIFEGACRNRARHHHCTSFTSSLSGCALAFRMSHAMHGCRRYQYGHAYRGAQYISAHVECAGANIYKHTRAKPDALKSGSVSSQRHLIVTTTLVEVPECRFHFGLGKHLVFKHVNWFQSRSSLRNLFLPHLLTGLISFLK